LCGQLRRSVTLCLYPSAGGSRGGAHGRCESAGVHGAPEEAGRLLLHLMAPPSCDLWPHHRHAHHCWPRPRPREDTPINTSIGGQKHAHYTHVTNNTWLTLLNVLTEHRNARIGSCEIELQNNYNLFLQAS